MLARNPGFAVAVVLLLALGIGACTAIFSVVDKVLVRPLPLSDAGRLLTIRETQAGRPRAFGVSGSVFQQLLEFTDQFDELSAYRDNQLALVRTHAPAMIWGFEVTPNFFSWLRTEPFLGRTFASGEGVLGKQDMVVLSHGFWKREFGGDPDIIGKSIPLSNETFVPGPGQLIRSFTVIGVMPPKFQFPSSNWGQRDANSYWRPRDLAAEVFPPRNRWAHSWTVLARPETNVSTTQVEAALGTLAARNAADFPQASKGWLFEVRPLNRLFWTADFRLTMASLGVAIGIVLFLACANVANLLLARMVSRNREFAIRAAVGAGQGRLMRQLLTESVLLAMLGGTAGLLVALWGRHVLCAYLPAELPRLREISLDGWAFGFAILLAIVTGVLFGLVPAWRVARTGTSGMLRDAGYGYTAGRERRLFQRGLVVTQIALTLVLLFGAGLMLKSVSRFLHVEAGYDPKNLLQFMVTHFNTEAAERNAKLSQHAEALAALPGVLNVTVCTHGTYEAVVLAGRDEPLPVRHTFVKVRDGDFFETWRIPVHRGRAFDHSDMTGTTVVINATMGRMLWPGEEAVGRWFQPANGSERCQVVGVVGDIVENPEQEPQPHCYEPYERLKHRPMSSVFTLRAATDPSALIPAVRKTLWQLDQSTVPAEMRLPEGRFASLVQPRSVFLRFLGCFAIIGLALAAIGVYSVLSHQVAARTHEIGVRIALGASKRDVLILAFYQGIFPITVGLVVGSLGSFMAGRLIQSKLFGVDATDPLTFITVCILLMVIGLIACQIPAWRASKVDPMVALRYE